MHFFFLSVFLLPLILIENSIAQESAKLHLQGKGWFQVGRIMHSSDTLSPGYNYNNNWHQGSGSQFTVMADIDENLQGAMGLGGFQFHGPQGTVLGATQINPGFEPFITEARFTYFMESRENPPLVLNFGLFPFQNSHDNRNLGAYLLRGPVYPGFLFSEFESQSLDPTIGNILGIHAQHNLGSILTHDLILRSEIDLPPIFDVSLIYSANVKLAGILELGAGVNFYRLLAVQPGATKLTDRNDFQISDPVDRVNPGEEAHPYYGNYAYIDTVSGDTTLLSHQGTKVMARMSFDPKPWMNADGWGPMDFKFFAEAAIIGVRDYKGVYPNILERIPLMFGLGIPSFGLLDEAVLEVEWYGAPFRNDYRLLMTHASPIPMNNKEYREYRGRIREPEVRQETIGGQLVENTYVKGTDIPWGDPYDVHNMQKDNWKWSLYLSKNFRQSIKVSFQVANDHFRPSNHINSDPTQVERLETAFTTLEDWYMMFRLGFFFK